MASASQVAIAQTGSSPSKPKMRRGSSMMLVIRPIPLIEKGILLLPAALNVPVKAVDRNTNGNAVDMMRRYSTAMSSMCGCNS